MANAATIRVSGRKIEIPAVLAILLPILAGGCSTAAINQKLDARLAQETSITQPQDFRREAQESIQKAPGLTEEQRSKLLGVRASVHRQMDDVNEQVLRLRAILVKDIATHPYDQDEVDLIKRRLQSYESKRVTILFDAIEEANQILGRGKLMPQPMAWDMMYHN